jgi:hypothetical protein
METVGGGDGRVGERVILAWLRRGHLNPPHARRDREATPDQGADANTRRRREANATTGEERGDGRITHARTNERTRREQEQDRDREQGQAREQGEQGQAER